MNFFNCPKFMERVNNFLTGRSYSRKNSYIRSHQSIPRNINSPEGVFTVTYSLSRCKDNLLAPG